MQSNNHWTPYLLRALSDELTPEERQALDAALAADASLQAEWAQLQQTQRLLAQQEFQVQPFLATRVMARLEAAQPSWRLAFARLVTPVLAVILMLLAITYWQEDALTFDTLAGYDDISVESVVMADWSGW